MLIRGCIDCKGGEMNAIKTVIGVLGALFALAHVVAIIMALLGPSQYEGTFAISSYMGHVVGIAVGGIIARVCFKKSGQPHNSPA